MKKFFKILGIIALIAVIGFSMVGCDFPTDDNNNNGGNGGNGGGGGSAGSTRDRAILVTVGYSSSHTISSSSEHWFKFVGDGNPVIFETRGSAVDTYMNIDDNPNSIFWLNFDDNSGEGNNVLLSRSYITSGTNYYVRITARSSTYGTYTFVVE